MSRKLNILQIVPKTTIKSGGSMQAFQLAQGLARRGHRVCFVCRPQEEDIKLDDNMELVQIRMRNEFDLLSVVKLYNLMIRHKTDVVHVHKGLAHTLAYMAAGFAKVPVFVVNRGVSFPLDQFNRIKYKWKRVSKIIAVSGQVKQILADSGKIAPDKITVIYGGTDLQKFDWRIKPDKIHMEFRIPEGSTLIGNIAYIREWKGQEFLLQAASQIIKSHPRTFFFIVGSSNNSLGERLKKIAAESGIQNNVIFTGHRDDVPQLLAAMDLTVNCSYAGEGLTGAIRESMAMKKPAISTDIGGNREIVINKQTGVLIPVKQVQPLVDAINFFMENPAERFKMGEAGYKMVAGKFTLDIRISQMESLYNDLLAKQT